MRIFILHNNKNLKTFIEEKTQSTDVSIFTSIGELQQTLRREAVRVDRLIVTQKVFPQEIVSTFETLLTELSAKLISVGHIEIYVDNQQFGQAAESFKLAMSGGQSKVSIVQVQSSSADYISRYIVTEALGSRKTARVVVKEIDKTSRVAKFFSVIDKKPPKKLEAESLFSELETLAKAPIHSDVFDAIIEPIVFDVADTKLIIVTGVPRVGKTTLTKLLFASSEVDVKVALDADFANNALSSSLVTETTLLLDAATLCDYTTSVNKVRGSRNILVANDGTLTQNNAKFIIPTVIDDFVISHGTIIADMPLETALELSHNPKYRAAKFLLVCPNRSEILFETMDAIPKGMRKAFLAHSKVVLTDPFTFQESTALNKRAVRDMLNNTFSGDFDVTPILKVNAIEDSKIWTALGLL